MAKVTRKARKIETGKGPALTIVNPNAAGIDIANSEMQVCVPADRDENNNRKFGVYTEDLESIAQWLVKCGIETVAMESTGVYWVGIYKMLTLYGIEVVLTDAAHVKNYTQHKTDENDASWLMTLHAYGLVKPCHQLDNFTRSMRNIYRHRQSLIQDSTQAVNRMHKALTQMNIKLSVAISDITGKSGRAVIEAIINGERDPKKLASLTSDRCRKSKEEIAKSLRGTWDEDLIFIVKQTYAQFKYVQRCIEECDQELDQMFLKAPGMPKDNEEPQGLVRSKKKPHGNAKVTIDVEKYCYNLWGTNLMTIPGFSASTVLGLYTELGPNFIEEFEKPEHFCSWCNLAPNTKRSGGVEISSRMAKRYNPVGQIFRVASGTVQNSKDELGNYYRRMRTKKGPTHAHVATAHKMCKIFYTLVKFGLQYDPTKIGPDEAEILRRKIAKYEREVEKNKRRLAEISQEKEYEKAS